MLNAADTVLIIIDLQEKLMNAMPHKERVYKYTNILIKTAQELGMPIMVTEQYPKGLGITVDEIKNCLSEHLYLDKITFSACVEQGFRDELDKLGRKTIIITGSETHICVLQTVRDLLGLGYNVHVPQEAVCSRTDDNYSNSLDLMREMGAVITNTETIIFDLLKKAGTPEFKVISPLIK